MSEKKNDVIHTRLPSDVRAEVKKVAGKRGESRYIRDAVVEKLEREQSKKP